MNATMFVTVRLGRPLHTDELSGSGLGEAGDRARFNPVKIAHAHSLQLAGDGPVCAG
jgi:hypothetical protein